MCSKVAVRGLQSETRRRQTNHNTTKHTAPRPGNLDTIDVAGSLDLNLIRQWCSELQDTHTWLYTLRLALSDNADSFMGFTEGPFRSVHRPALEFEPNLRQLVVQGVLRALTNNECRRGTPAGYFEVPKTDDLTRAIFDARPANDLFGEPPEINLPYFPAYLEALALFRAVYCASLDLRHWFFQIMLPECLRKHFMIRSMAGTTYIPMVWPMGFKWSPFIAQAIAWLLVIVSLRRTSLVFNLEQRDNTQMPSSISVTHKGVSGRILLFYDNILIVTEGEELFVVIAQAITETFKEARAVFKTDANPKHTAPMQSMTRNETSYLGAHLLWTEEAGLQARALEQTLHKWKVCTPLNTRRQIAQHLGQIIWWYSITCRPLYRIREVVHITTLVGGGDSDWDENFTLTDTQRDAIGQARTTALLNEWVTIQKPPTEWLTAASDASDTGIGGVYVMQDGTVEAFARPLPLQLKDQIIYIREIVAAVLTVEVYTSLTGPSNLLLAVDNAPAYFALSKGYSFAPGAQHLIDIINRRREAGLRVKFAWVPSELNPADMPSRGKLLNDPMAIEHESVTKGLPYVKGLDWAKTYEPHRAQ
jgi:hypothetical protein